MQNLKDYPISLAEVIRASTIVADYMSPSQMINYPVLSKLLGMNIWVKHENQNITGSFKIRGGLNLLSNVQQKGLAGVVTFSTGNHGLSVATAAMLHRLPAVVVVPEGANPVKTTLIREAGAQVIEAGKHFDEAALVVDAIACERGYYNVHPANEPHLINGVGTGFLEVFRSLPEIDAIVLPLGGGSEVAAAVVTLKALKPEVEIYAVQAELSCAAYKSWLTGKICESDNNTFAGGFATGTAYDTTFALYRDHLTDFVLLNEQEIMKGIALAAYHTHNLNN